MRERTLARSLVSLLALALVPVLAGAAGAGPSSYEPPRTEIGAYRFLSEADDAISVFLNPAGLGGGHGSNLYLDLSGGEDGVDEFATSLQGGSWGMAYRHRDRGTGLAETGNVDTYTLSSAQGSQWFRFGISREWTRTDLSGHDASAWHLGIHSRPGRRLSLGAVLENANRPEVASGKIRPRYRYGLSLRPLGASAENLTLSVEGTHRDGDDRVGLAYGASFSTAKGLGLAVTVQDPNGEPVEIGGSITTRWGHGSASARVRSASEPENARGQVALHVYDEFWTRARAGRARVATITLKGRYAEEGSGFVLLGGSSRSAREVIDRIDHAARDADIRALAVRVENLSGAFLGPVTAQIDELRTALLRFRESGKPVVTYLAAMANGPAETYLASAGDRVLLTPLGGVHSFGVSVHITREKRMLEKLGVAFDADTAGVYKSTFHGFYTDSASADQREIIQGLVDVAYDHLVSTVQTTRGMSEADMAALATGRVVFPEECVSLGLVDELGWWDDALKTANALSGGGDGPPPKIPLPRRRYWNERWAPAPAVAVVPASGGIRSGRSRQDWLLGGSAMGSQTVEQQLRAAAAHPGVRAIVFRVDSGGGSVLASEEIRRAILEVKAKYKKPFLVSMGNAAASGGYWISMDADTVIANPMTRTGSIGVFWAIPVFEDLYEKMGITSETYKRGEHADMFSTARHMTPEERAMLDASLDYSYDAFIRGIVEGRGLPESKVRSLAEGRVYFGIQARELGLVDELGTLHDTIELAAEMAGISEDYRVLTVRPRRRSLWRTALVGLAGASEGSWLEGLLEPRGIEIFEN